MLSNAAAISGSLLGNYDKTEQIRGLLITYSACIGVRDTLFNLGHWVYSFAYWKSSIEINDVLTAG